MGVNGAKGIDEDVGSIIPSSSCTEYVDYMGCRGILGAATQAPSPLPPISAGSPGHGESQPQYDPFGQQAASIQALTSVGNDLVYAGSFGLGLFPQRGSWRYLTNRARVVTDPFILTLTRGKTARSMPEPSWRGLSFARSRKSWQAVNSGLKASSCFPEVPANASRWKRGKQRQDVVEDRWLTPPAIAATIDDHRLPLVVRPHHHWQDSVRFPGA